MSLARQPPRRHAVPAGHVADRDAPVIASLRQAGAVFVGKTNLHEFAFGTTSEDSAFGPANNPYDVTLSPGRLERRLWHQRRRRYVLRRRSAPTPAAPSASRRSLRHRRPQAGPRRGVDRRRDSAVGRPRSRRAADAKSAADAQLFIACMTGHQPVSTDSPVPIANLRPGRPASLLPPRAIGRRGATAVLDETLERLRATRRACHGCRDSSHRRHCRHVTSNIVLTDVNLRIIDPRSKRVPEQCTAPWTSAAVREMGRLIRPPPTTVTRSTPCVTFFGRDG